MQPTRPLLVAHQGKLAWRFDDGTIRPYVGGAAEGDDEKKFTQADLDRLISERLARVKHEPPADYDDLRAKAAKLDQLEAANKTELEAAQARIAELEGKVTKTEGERDAARADVTTEKLRSAFVSAAANAKVVNPEQAFVLLTKEQRDALTIGDDGQVKGAAEVATKFVAENPHFVGQPVRKVPVPDPAQGQRQDANVPGAAGKAEAAKRFGPPAAAGQQK